MKYNYVSNIDSEKGIVTMLLHGEIGNQISGAAFAREMKSIVDFQSSLKKINVSINSPGGMVFDGYSIISAMDYAKSKGVEVDTHVDGIAASMACPIAVNGDKVFCSDYSMLMIHDPFDPEGNADTAVTKMFKDSLVAIMSGKTGIDKAEMATMMEKETWMTPKEAKRKRFVDEIKSTTKRASIPTNSTALEIYAIMNSILKEETKKDEPIKTPDMKKIANFYKLNESATEEAILLEAEKVENSLKLANKSVEDITKERDALKLKVTAFEAAEVTAKEAQVTAFLENAIKEGKVKAEEKDTFAALLKSDFANTKKLIEAKPKQVEGVKILDQAKKDAFVKGLPEGREKWNIRDWEKKDPKGLAEIKKSTPEVFQEMHDAFYKEVTARQDEKRS